MTASNAEGEASIGFVTTLRRQLAENGFRPIALATGTKRPIHLGWPERARRNPPSDVVEVPTLDALNTGLLCDGLRVLDIDVDDPTIAAQAYEIAIDLLGATIERTRQNSPRRALLYRAEVGEPTKVEIKGPAGKVEVLGRGQQLHAYGIHPSGVPVSWAPTGPDTTPIEAVRAVTEDQIIAYLAAVAPLIGATAPTVVPTDAPSLMGNDSVVDTACSTLVGGEAARIFKTRPLPDMAAAAVRGRYSMEEVKASLASVPSGFSGHPFGKRDAWLYNIVFPLADYVATHPEHQAEMLKLFDAETRRIADPTLVASYAGGSVAYFANAMAEFRAAITSSRKPRARSITISHLIQSALGNRPEAVQAGWGGKWDGRTAVHLRAANANTPPSSVSNVFRRRPLPSAQDVDAVNHFGKTKPRRWIYCSMLERGKLSLLAGPGMTGKSSYTVGLALACITARSDIMGAWVHSSLNVMIINLDDDQAEMLRRVEAAMIHHGINPATVRGRLSVIGSDMFDDRLVVPDPKTRMPMIDDVTMSRLTALALRQKIDVIIIDPLANFMVGNENDASTMNLLASALTQLAVATGAAVLGVAHTRKGSRSDLDGQDALRGSSALAGRARAAVGLDKATPEEAAALGVIVEAWRLLVLTNTKANNSAISGKKPYWLESHMLNNADPAAGYPQGDSVQVITVFDAARHATGISMGMLIDVRDAIDKGVPGHSGGTDPMSPSKQSKNRYAGTLLAPVIQTHIPATDPAAAASHAMRVIAELKRLGWVVERDDMQVSKPGGGSNKNQKGYQVEWSNIPVSQGGRMPEPAHAAPPVSAPPPPLHPPGPGFLQATEPSAPLAPPVPP